MGSNVKDKWFLLKQLIYQSLSAKKKKEFLEIEVYQADKKKICCEKCGRELILTGTLPRGP